jgi:serine protease Do
MAFGGWMRDEGVHSDDPWNRKDGSAERIQAQGRLHAAAEEKPRPEAARQSQARQSTARESSAARQNTKTAGRSPLRLLVILLAIFSLVSGVLGAVLEHIAEPPRFAEPTPPQMWDDTDDTRDFFRQYFQSGSGNNHLQRIMPDAAWTLELQSEPGEEISLQEIYEKCIPSIVAIVVHYDDSSTYFGWGTGVIFTEDGYIITNSHVLDDAQSAFVRLYDDREFEARLVDCDSANDIAVIKIECDGLQSAEFGDSDLLRVGDAVVAIGNPMNPQLRGTMTSGIVSAIDRQVPVDGNVMTLIQTDAAINGGNSGGALIDRAGRVVGITNMKMMSYASTVEGLCFAIPTRSVQTIVNRFIAGGYTAGTPGLGLTVGPVDAATRQQFGLPEGLYVNEVVPDSGADAAGIREGDVIIAADGIPLYDTEDLAAVKNEKEIGGTLRLTVWRDGEEWECEVALLDMRELFS